MKWKRVAASCLALVLSVSLAAPAAAADTADTAALTAQQAADQAAAYALQYGGAASVQYALWEDGEVTLTGGAGVYSKTENRALTDDILYGVGSVSKMYTTAAVMLLVEEGKVDLDAPVTAYLPEFTMADERYQDITVRMLLNHSSGLMGSTTGSAFLYDDPTETRSTDDLLERLSTQRLKADPGAYSVYCNDGFTLAELVVEAVSGLDFTEFLHTYLTEPAGLDDTLTPADPFDTDRLAKTYLTADSTQALPVETVNIVGCGGIYATASDLARFGGLLCGEELLTQASLDAMAAAEYANGLWPEDSEDDVLSYGLGWDAVQFFPFRQNDIQALVKGGDTLNYHSGLIVLPEYDMAVAVVSSGGVSTVNELAGVRILIDALARKGVSVDETLPTLPDAQPADMPAELTDCSGIYVSSTAVMVADVAQDGTLTFSAPAALGGSTQTLTYYSDGSFRDADNTFLVKFVTEENGETYLFQKVYTQLPGLTGTCSASYTHQKVDAKALDEETLAAWQARGQMIYLPLTEVWSSQVWLVALPASTAPLLDETPGWLISMEIQDANTALSVVQIPGTAGRDCYDVIFQHENGTEFLTAAGTLYGDLTLVELISGYSSSVCTIQSSGWARWYSAGTAAGKTMNVSIQGDGSFTVYDAQGALAASSLLGQTAVTLPEGGWIVFAGDAGTQFSITME